MEPRDLKTAEIVEEMLVIHWDCCCEVEERGILICVQMRDPGTARSSGEGVWDSISPSGWVLRFWIMESGGVAGLICLLFIPTISQY